MSVSCANLSHVNLLSNRGLQRKHSRAQGKYYGHVVRSPQAVGYQHACKIGHQDLVEARCNVACRAVATYEGELVPGEKRFGIVVSKFNDLITNKLLEGALAGLKRFGVNEDSIDVTWVPGSFELPVVAKGMGLSGQYSAIICIGAVIRGSTSHYDAVVNAATSGILSAGLDSGVPVIFGVLTCDNLEQALDRAGGKLGNKGYEFAITALETANLLTTLEHEGNAVQSWGSL